MIFRLKRSSQLPLLIEEEDLHSLKTLEEQGRWADVSDLEDQLRDSDDLKELDIEAGSIEELYLALTLFDPTAKFLIDFKEKVITICDTGEHSI